MAGVASPAAAVDLLKLAKDATGGDLEAFELICAFGMEMATAKRPGARLPLETRPPWYVLIEIASGREDTANLTLEALLAEALSRGMIDDAVIAANEAQAQALWALREGQSEAQKGEGPVWKHDVSLPISRVADFIDQAGQALAAQFPGVRIDAFGHVGDGNIHYDVLGPTGGDPARHSETRQAGARIVHDLVNSLGGSISAEHGLGVMKTNEARRYKSPVEIAALEAVRSALDPKGIMNPRVLFSASPPRA
jgi:FAD/FMN-containing dehydrogenase